MPQKWIQARDGIWATLCVQYLGERIDDFAGLEVLKVLRAISSESKRAMASAAAAAAALGVRAFARTQAALPRATAASTASRLLPGVILCILHPEFT